MKKQLFFFLLIGLLCHLGCGRQSLYVKSSNKDKTITPKVYTVHYDKGFLLALHAAERPKNWTLNYFDKSTGVIEVQTAEKDILTIRIQPVDSNAVKVVAYVDSDEFVLDPNSRFQKSIALYYDYLNDHLIGFNENK